MRNYKAKDLFGNWKYGFFTKEKKGSLIVPVLNIYKEWDYGDYIDSIQIDSTTLCQSTGLKDIKGNEIYEGDLVNGVSYNGSYKTGYIIYKENSYYAIPENGEGFSEDFSNMEVIGNIHD